MLTPDAKRGPTAQPSPVPGTFATTTNTAQRSKGLQLPDPLERRLTAIEAELAAVRACVMACSPSGCSTACPTKGGAS